MAGVQGSFPPYYPHPGHGGQIPPPGVPFRPYGQMHLPPPPNVSNPSLQSMTSHWNLHPPAVPSLAPNTMVTPNPVNSNSNRSTGSVNKTQQSSSGIKPPKAPEKPLLPYMRYSRKMWEQFKKTEGSDLKVWEVGKIIGQKWRELPEVDKQPYFDEYEAEKSVYDELMKTYRNSTAYKQFLEAKKLAERQAAPGGASVSSMNSPLSAPPPAVIAPPRQSSDARLLMLQQQQEEDTEDEYLTYKQLASVRFHRNHRLMAEIFGDSVVPDTRTAVNPARLEALKQQAQSLAVHQKKLEDEVNQLETKYSEKRTKFLDDAERFRKELQRIQDNPPTTWKKPQVQLTAKDFPEPSKNLVYKELS